MKEVNIRVYCEAFYDTRILVPEGLSPEEEIEYANNHLDDVELNELEFLEDHEIDHDLYPLLG